MMSKFAPPFWLCLTAGMVAGIATGRAALGLVIGAVAGVVLGLLFLAAAKRHKRDAFCVPLAGAPEAPPANAAPGTDLPRVA